MTYDFAVVGTAATVSVLKVNKMPECGASTPVLEGSVTHFQNGGMGFNICAALAELGCKVYPLLTYADARQHDYLHGYFASHNLPEDGLCDPPFDSCGTTIMIQDAEKNHMTLITEYNHRLVDSPYFGKQSYAGKFDNVKYVILSAPLPVNTENAINEIINSQRPLVLSMRKDQKAFPHDLLWKALINAQYVFANESEVNFIVKEYSLSRIEELFDKGKLKCLAKTLGKAGSLVLSKADNGVISNITVPAVYCKNPIVDSVGAGDGYVSGFMYGQLKHLCLRDCALLGSTLSSFVLEGEGSITNLPTEKALIERFENNQM